MRRITRIVLLMVLIMMLSGCYMENENSMTVDIDVDFGYSGVLTSAPLAQVEQALAEWEEAHPEVVVQKRDRIRNEDFMNLGVLGANHLPDVFITDTQTGRLLSEYGLILDPIDYSYPVFRESVSVIVYDPLTWEDGSPVGFCSESGYDIVDDYLSSCLASEEGQDWLFHMIEGDCECSFTDEVFIQAMSDLLTRIGNDIPYSSFDELMTAFADGSCSAVSVSGTRVFALLDYVQSENPCLYDRLGFTTMIDGYIPVGYQYRVYISAAVDEDEFDECIDLAMCLSNSFEEVSDPSVERLRSIINNSEHIAYIRQYFRPHFWQYSVDNCFSEVLTYSRTPEEYVSVIQDYYEIYYLYNFDK